MERIGERLRKRREELGFTIDDIARATKFRSEMIKAVEDGRPGVFQADVYLKSFLRAYASKLGLDPEEILRGQKSEEERIQEAIGAIRIGPRPRGDLRKVLLWVGIVAIAGAGSFLVYSRVLRGMSSPGEEQQVGGRTLLPADSHGDSLALVGGVDTLVMTRSGAVDTMLEDTTQLAPREAFEEALPASSVAVRPLPSAVPEETVTPGETATQKAREDVEPHAAGAATDESPPSVTTTEPQVEPVESPLRWPPGSEPDSLEISVSGWSTDVKLLTDGSVLVDGTLHPGYRKTFYSTEPFFFDYITNKDAISLLHNGLPVRLPNSSGRLVADFSIPPAGR